MIQLFALFPLLFLLFAHSGLAALVEITPSEVYSQVMQIDKEVDLLQKHFGSTGIKEADIYNAHLRPRHVWVNTYVIMVQINVLRKKLGLPRNEPNYMEPELDSSPGLVFEQSRRLLAELHIVKKHLGITAKVSAQQQFSGKRSIDVFNRLRHISCQLDILNGEEINPNYTFAEVMRIHEDAVTVLRTLQLRDISYPPGKEEKTTPADSLKAAFALMAEIQRLQRSAGLIRTDFSIFDKKREVLPSDVFNMIGMCLAEMQTVKVYIGLKHSVTTPAACHEGKSANDVHQLLRWTTRILRQIRRL